MQFDSIPTQLMIPTQLIEQLLLILMHSFKQPIHIHHNRIHIIQQVFARKTLIIENY